MEHTKTNIYFSLAIIISSLMVLSSLANAAERPVYFGDVFDADVEKMGIDQNTLILDQDNTGGNIRLQFGNTLNESLLWDEENQYFLFSNDVNLGGNELLDFRIERQDGNVRMPPCEVAADVGREYYDTSDGNGYICIESDPVNAPGTYEWFDFTKGWIFQNRRDALMTELNAETDNGDFSEHFSFFVDSFEDATKIDGSSIDYYLDATAGMVGKYLGGGNTFTRTTTAEFNEGTHINTEAFTDTETGENGEIRKLLLIAPTQSPVEDFDELSDITTTGPVIKSLNNTASNLNQGAGSLQFDVDFSGVSQTETASWEKDLGPTGQNWSNNTLLKLSYRRHSDEKVRYQIELRDTTGATWTSPLAFLSYHETFEVLEIDLSSVTGIDMSSVRYVQFILVEDTGTPQEFINNSYTNGPQAWQVIESGWFAEQHFKLSEDIKIGRIRFRARWDSNTQPTDPLYIGVMDVFDTALARSVLQPVDSTRQETVYEMTFNEKVPLSAGVTYKIRFYSASQSGDGWEISYHGDDTIIPGGNFIRNGDHDLGRDMSEAALIPAVKEEIHFDNLYLESETTYTPSGTWTSQCYDLGTALTGFDSLYWQEVLNGEEITIAMRTGADQASCKSAVFSTEYTDSTGIGNDISGVPVNRYVGFRATFPNGSTNATALLRNLNLDYTTSNPTGATITSAARYTDTPPKKFLLVADYEKNSGSVDFFISRDGKATWQAIAPSDRGEMRNFTSGSGTQIHIRANINGNATIKGWGFVTDQDLYLVQP